MKTGMNYLKEKPAFIVLCVVIVLLSCSSPESDFEKAKQTNTIEAYQRFISKYPENSLSKDAVALRDRLAFENVKKSNSITSLELFIKDYPNNPFLQDAIALRDQIIFEKALETNSLDSLQTFIQRYPDSALLPQAKEEISLLKKERDLFNAKSKYSEGEDILKALTDYLVEYPEGRFSRDARDEIDSAKKEVFERLLSKAKQLEDSAKSSDSDVKAAQDFTKSGEYYENLARLQNLVGDNSIDNYKKAAYTYYRASRMLQRSQFSSLASAVNRFAQGSGSLGQFRNEAATAVSNSQLEKSTLYEKAAELFRKAGMNDHANWMVEDGNIKNFELKELE